jgi:hypothetical protein
MTHADGFMLDMKYMPTGIDANIQESAIAGLKIGCENAIEPSRKKMANVTLARRTKTVVAESVSPTSHDIVL